MVVKRQFLQATIRSRHFTTKWISTSRLTMRMLQLLPNNNNIRSNNIAAWSPFLHPMVTRVWQVPWSATPAQTVIPPRRALGLSQLIILGLIRVRYDNSTFKPASNVGSQNSDRFEQWSVFGGTFMLRISKQGPQIGVAVGRWSLALFWLYL